MGFISDTMKWISIVLIVCFAASDEVSAKCWNVSQVMDLPEDNIYAPRRYWQRQAEPILRGALYQMEDFIECLNELDGHYCMIRIQLQPIDNSTKFWQTIQEHNSFHTNFRRDIVNVGLCVPKYCTDEDVIENLVEFFTPAANKLSVSVNITISGGHCTTNEKKALGTWDFVALFVVTVIFLLVVSGTSYDLIGRVKPFKNTSCIRAGEFLMCFSVLSNVRILIKVSDSEDSIMFRGIQGIRAVSMYLVILAHVCLMIVVGPVRNPEMLERNYRDPMRIGLTNGHATMGTFLCISGMMLSYFFLKEYEAKKSIRTQDIIKAIFHRYMRLTPPMALVMLLQFTFFDKTSIGPMRSTINPYIENCRFYGWTNLLYIHNLNGETICLPQTWYVAADFQCYILYLLLMIPVCKYPKHSKKIFAVALLFWIIVPFVQTYVERLDPVLFSTPETLKFLLEDRTFNRRYITMHGNAGSFTIGIIFGYLLYNLKRIGFKCTKKMCALMWLINFSVPWIILALPIIFYLPSYTYNVVGISIFASIGNVILAAGIGTMILTFSLGYGGLINGVMSWQGLQILGRLSYTVYLIHIPLLVYDTSTTMQPIYVTEYVVAEYWFKTIVASTVFAFVLTLCVELPTSTLMKLFFNREHDRSHDKSHISYNEGLQKKIMDKTTEDNPQGEKVKATRSEYELEKMPTINGSITDKRQEETV